jgi:hypothetical protein
MGTISAGVLGLGVMTAVFEDTEELLVVTLDLDLDDALLLGRGDELLGLCDDDGETDCGIGLSCVFSSC